MTLKQILDINNASRYFIKEYCRMNNTQIWEEIPLNYTRYRLLRFYDSPEYVFFKFTRNPYFMAKEGLSETINVKEVKNLVKLHNNGKLYRLYFALNDGKIYTIRLLEFLEKAYIEVENRQEAKAKYVIAYKHMRRFNNAKD